jgi:hypothetical protein
MRTAESQARARQTDERRRDARLSRAAFGPATRNGSQLGLDRLQELVEFGLMQLLLVRAKSPVETGPREIGQVSGAVPPEADRFVE